MPVYVQYIYLSLKARSFVFFSAANPIMEMGGFSNYSKYDVLKNLPDKFKPKTFFLKDADTASVEFLLQNNNTINYPFILKPDRGERGFGVAKILTRRQLEDYLKNGQRDVILQEYIDYPVELGVMYYRIPGEKKGKISSIVIKEFLYVKGDGKSNLRELVHNGERTKYYLPMLLDKFENDLYRILKDGEYLELEAIGNHCRGTKFINGNYLINERLIRVFDDISIELSGFNFGRYDLRVPSIESLYHGEEIMIMEVNGANSEPAHIYDPNTNLISAYRDLFRHWKNLYRVSVVNHNLNNVPYMPLGEARRKIRSHLKYKRNLQARD